MAFWEYDFSSKDDRRDEFVKHHSVRQNAIRELVRSQSVRTQRELVSLLKKRGFVCTQATVSRDTAEMDLQTLPEGGYVLSEDVHLQRMLCDGDIFHRKSRGDSLPPKYGSCGCERH